MATKRGVSFAQFERIALDYPGVVTRSSFGAPAVYAGRKFMARLREPGVLVLTPVYEDEQRFLMETRPEAFFLTDHYRGYPAILIRLAEVDRGQLAELLDQAWRRLAGKRVLAAYDAERAVVAPPRAKQRSRAR